MNKLFFYCYISSNSGLFLVFGTFLDFDTSYIKVYRGVCNYDSMLKFILPYEMLQLSIRYFKTSHVKVYRKLTKRRRTFFIISKHPMLKFIAPALFWHCQSCAISKHPMLKFILNPVQMSFADMLFQNISC